MYFRSVDIKRKLKVKTSIFIRICERRISIYLVATHGLDKSLPLLADNPFRDLDLFFDSLQAKVGPYSFEADIQFRILLLSRKTSPGGLVLGDPGPRGKAAEDRGDQGSFPQKVPIKSSIKTGLRYRWLLSLPDRMGS